VDRPRRLQVPQPPLAHEPTADLVEREKWAQYAFQMHALKGTQGWDTYRELLSEVEKQMIQALVSGPAEKHDYLAGYIAGLRNAFNMPEFVLQKQKELAPKE